MVLLESTNINIGTKMPDFELFTPDGTPVSASQHCGPKGLLIAFTCNHCPYAIAVWPRLIDIAGYAESVGVTTLAVNPNIHPNYPDDRPEKMLEKIDQWQIPFPYLVDEDQQVAKRYDAQCTPDIYLVDAEFTLVYHGRIDDNWQQPDNVTRQDLKTAIGNLAEGKPALSPQYPSMGCSIKWR